MNRKILMAAVVAGAFSLPAFAQAPGSGSTGGADPGQSSVPNQQGGNGSGPVSPSRGAAVTSPSGTASFRSLDANGDGYVSRAEAAAAGYTSRFDAMDTDRDGRVSEREWAAATSSTSGSSTAPSTVAPRDPNPGTMGGNSPVPGAVGSNPNAPQR